MRAPDYTTPEMWENVLLAAHIYPTIIAGAGGSNRCCFLYADILRDFVLLGTKQCWIAGTEILSRDRLFQSWWSTWGIYCKPTSVRYVKCVVWFLKPPAEPLLPCQPPRNPVVGHCPLEPLGSLGFFHCSRYWPAVGATCREEWLGGGILQRSVVVTKSRLALPARHSHDATAVVT